MTSKKREISSNDINSEDKISKKQALQEEIETKVNKQNIAHFYPFLFWWTRFFRPLHKTDDNGQFETESVYDAIASTLDIQN